MEYSDIQPLINAYHRKLSATDLRFRRYLYADIDWNVRLLGIKGARGVGKTTLLLQHIKEAFSNPDDVMYVSLDNLWFNSHEVGAVAELTMPKQGDFLVNGKYVFEVGGSRKTFEQIANVPDSYLAIDDIETGNKNRMPLWVFGCLY